MKEEVWAADDLVGRLIERLTRFGPAADRLADIPPQLFEGLDVRKLNYAYLPPDMGGLPLLQSGVIRCVLMELLGFADAALAAALPGPGLALPPILGLASPDQREELLGRFDKAGPVWGAFAMTEPGGGSDAAKIETTARKDGNQGFVLDGEKCLIGNGGRADFVVTYATVDPARGRFGIQPFVVDRGTAGLEIDDSVPMLGLRAVRVAKLRFTNCWVPRDRLLGDAEASQKAGAFLSAQRTWEYMRPGLSAVIVGAIERLLAELDGLADRQGSSGFRQDVDSLISRVRPRLGSTRLLAHHAALLFDQNEQSAVISSMAKVTAAGLARSTAREAMLLLRTAGVQEGQSSREIDRWVRDFQAFELMEGTTEVHQLMITKGWSVRARRLRKKSMEGGKA